MNKYMTDKLIFCVFSGVLGCIFVWAMYSVLSKQPSLCLYGLAFVFMFSGIWVGDDLLCCTENSQDETRKRTP